MLALFTWCRSYVGLGFRDWGLGFTVQDWFILASVDMWFTKGSLGVARGVSLVIWYSSYSIRTHVLRSIDCGSYMDDLKAWTFVS